jgi:glycosyltransferase involved in cell wall biosynthesis
MAATRPFVSVLTPTADRRKFIPWAIQMFRAQTYPQDRMEWIVLDDGADKVGDLFAASGLKNVRYVSLPDGERLKIGAKRNRLNKLAKGDICVCWDDDDYYPPDRVRQSVLRLCSSPGRRIPVAGCSKLYLYYADRREIWSIGPYNPNHCTNGTMAYWRTYTKDHHYDDNAEKAEERQFMDDWKTRVVQMDPDDVMLVICHSRNTFDKRKLLEKHNPTMKKTDFKIKRFVKEKKIAEFYNSLMADFTDEKPGPVAAPTPEELNPALQFVGRSDASATPMESPSTVPTLEVSELPSLPDHPAPPATPPATESPPPVVPPPTEPQEPPAASLDPSPAAPQSPPPTPPDHPVPSSALETDASGY